MSTFKEAPALHSQRSQKEVRSVVVASSKILNAVDVREVDRDTLEPILFLLQNSDIEVQRAASAALGNLAVNSKVLPSRENSTDVVKLRTRSR